MDAKAALAAYRESTDPRIREAFDSFSKLKAPERYELLYYMICNTNLLLTGGEHEAVGAALVEDAPVPDA